MLEYLDHKFQYGYDDARNGLESFRKEYDDWNDTQQIDYELGRLLFMEYGDQFLIRNMKTAYYQSIEFSDAITNVYFSVYNC